MKYNEKSFNSAVEDYKNLVGNVKSKDFFIKFDLGNKNAFYSLAPLSRALHDLGADASCIGINKTSESFEAVKEVYKKAKGEFRKLFRKPDVMIEAGENKFTGDMELPFHAEWFKDYRMDELMQTSEILWKEVYNIKKGERVGIGFS